MQNAMILNGVISYFANFAMGQIYSAANILQVISHMGFINGKIPACLLDFLTTIHAIVTFELVPEEYLDLVSDFIFNLPSDIPYMTHFVEYKQESGYILKSMFFPLFIIFVMILYYIGYGLIHCCLINSDTERLQKLKIRAHDKI